jgi:hypothetical protein
MSDPIQDLFGGGALRQNLFSESSRYARIGTATLETPNGPVTYLRRRFVPPPDRFTTLYEYTVADGDRLDLIAAKALPIGDSEKFWLICDANNALRPEELTEAGNRVLRITGPEGVPGAAND